MAVLTWVTAGRAAVLPDLFGGGRLVAYTPRGYDPSTGRPPGPASLRADADELRRLGFRAITTFSATSAICRLFKRRGFRTVLVGVADPADRGAVRAAIKQRRCADAYVIGNGGLAAGRYTRDDLARAIRRIRSATGKPATVRETIASYDDDPSLLALGDWLFPIANPYRARVWHPQEACGWSVRRYSELKVRVPATTPVVLAETGLPSGGAATVSENYQRAFFPCLESRRVQFEYFEAFDQSWRTDAPLGSHWGLLRTDGTPKMLAASLAAPEIDIRARDGWVRGQVRNVAGMHFAVVVYARDATWNPTASIPIMGRGKWKASVAGGRAVVALLVARDYVPPGGVDRPPVVDWQRVFASAGPAGAEP